MNQPIEPTRMRPYARHILICTHGDCAPSQAGEALNAGMRARLGLLRKLRNPERVKCSTVDCLGVCQHGPIVAVYPDGIWYHHVTPEVMDRIVAEHIVEGHPVEEYVFHRLYPAAQTPAYAPELRGDAGTFVPSGAPIAEQARNNADVRICSVMRDDESMVEYAPAPDADPTASVGPRGFPAGAPDPDTRAAEAEQRRRAARRQARKKGLVIVNTGEGKGKTTAAFGLVTRAWGRNLRVGVFQFLKNEHARFGEIRAAAKMGIEIIPTGDGWTWTSDDLDASAARARHGWEKAQSYIVSGEYDVLVLDEFTYPLHYGWLDVTEVVAWLAANKPPMLHLVITGRYAPSELIAFADLVTEMREIKHPLPDQGIRAQPGVEF